MSRSTTVNSPSFSFQRRELFSAREKRSVRIVKPTFYVGGYNGGPIVDQILTKRGWIKLKEKSDTFNLAWTEVTTQINFSILNPVTQLVNHIPNNSILTNKLGLLQSLRNYEKQCKTFNISNLLVMKDFTPETFVVDDLKERNDFFNTFKDGDMWICKPINANQGKGINLIRDLNKFKTEVLEKTIKNKTMWNLQTKIIQRYITNPLLIEGRKFDIRCYMLIASTMPYLVLFCPGYIRLSLNKYDNSDNNLVTHLTNQFVQKQSPKYDSLKENSVWSINKFNDYFNDNYTHLSNFKENWVHTELADTVKDILRHVFKSVKYRLASSYSFFELYGFDLMIDDTLKIWLIEANSNPSMSSSCELLKEIIPPIIEEVLFISLECFEKNTKLQQPLEPLSNIINFQIIYSESYESARLRKSNRISNNYFIFPSFKSFSVPKRKTTISQEYPIERIKGKITVPIKPSNKEAWINRWNQMNDDYMRNRKKPSISLTERISESIVHREGNEKRQADKVSLEKLRKKTFSGDSKVLEKAVETDFYAIFEEKVENIDDNLRSATMQNKLKEVIKNH